MKYEEALAKVAEVFGENSKTPPEKKLAQIIDLHDPYFNDLTNGIGLDEKASRHFIDSIKTYASNDRILKERYGK